MDSLILQTAIGLVFIFGITAAAVSAVTEGVSRFVGLRAEYLLRGVRTLVDGKSDFGLWRRRPDKTKPDKTEPARVAQIMNHPLVASSATEAKPPAQAGNTTLTNAQRRALPSYISGQTFAKALIDVLLPGHFRLAGAGAAAGSAGRAAKRSRPSAKAADAAAEAADAAAEAVDAAAGAADAMAALRSWADAAVAAKSPDPLAEALRPMLVGAQDNMQAFEASVARWYDDHMARVSGWYKRHVRWISLSIGLVLVIVFNLDAIRIADSLYSDQAVRGSVVTQATRAASCGDKQPAACLADLQAKIGLLRLGGLPVGWAGVPACAQRSCSWLDRRGLTNPGKNGIDSVGAILLALLGWGLMVAALIPGARFWFDLLSRLGTLRSTGPRPSP
ncbi:MAG TPA: hypothetical protein VF256_18035 [Streptosporangiaceae bacterium]